MTMMADVYARMAKLGIRTGLRLYTLDGDGRPVDAHASPTTDAGRLNLLAWGEWMQQHRADQVVGFDDDVSGWWISTRFMGYDLRVVARAGTMPLVFETIAFDPEGHVEEQERVTTRAEAVFNHAAVKARVEARLGRPMAERKPREGGE